MSGGNLSYVQLISYIGMYTTLVTANKASIFHSGMYRTLVTACIRLILYSGMYANGYSTYTAVVIIVEYMRL